MKNSGQLSESKRQLLERVLRGEMGRETWEAPLLRHAPGTTVPLAPSQQQVWLHSQMGDTRFVYNEPITIHYHGVLDQHLLELSFQEFLRRHEIWRTTFAIVDNQVVQLVQPKLELEIPLTDLTALPDEDREAEATRIATLDAQRPFDLAVGPLLRGRLFKLRDDKFRFHITLHHIIFDGVSIYRTVLPELAAIYNAFAKGEPSPLPEPELQYGDFALWQERLQQTPSVREQVTYWKEQLAGELPILELPTDHARPQLPSYRGGMEKFAISAELSSAVKRRSKTEGVTHYMFLLAAFKAMLHRYSGQEDILVGGATDGRRRREFHNLIGYFLNTLVLRTKPKGSLTFRDYLAQVKDAATGALANSDVPFDRLVRELQLKRDSSRHPIFQALFSIEPPATPVDMPWELTQMDIATGASKVDLYLEIDEHEDHLIARFIYNTDIFERSTVQRMVGHWLSLLDAAVDDAGTLLRDLPMLTAEEEQWLGGASKGPRSAVPQTTIHGLIEAQAALTPSAVAVEFGAQSLTYRELDHAADTIAQRLIDAGVEPGTLIGFCGERSANMVAALLGILKSGGAYVPIDPALPQQRIAMMVGDAKAPVIVTERHLAASLLHTGARVVCFEECLDENFNGSATHRAPLVTPDDLAYVMYTSGSTGKPKGVEVSHGAMVNLLLSMQQEPGFTAADKLLAVTTVSFDIAGLELYLPLISGGTVTIASREDARDPARLMTVMRESNCNVMQATPATWRSLIDAQWPGDARLKVLCGGEALPRDLVKQLAPRCLELWNLYGPTETTVWSTIHKVDTGTNAIPIGRPIANTDIFILDAHLNLLPIGAPGELYIGGAGLARGYHDRAELTAERFIASPFDPTQRLYRTGDLARWLADGTLECLGRADNQVKIRGFRIEIEEIETSIASHPDVRQAAVKAWPSTASDGASLVAYVVAPLHPDLRRYLMDTLPEYMVPSRFVFLDALPLTPNGKVDRNALPAPLQQAAQPAGPDYAPPSNGIERRLASVFESVLDLPKVGIRDNFFDLGGHSLLVAKLLRRVEMEFGRRLTMSVIFQSPTIEHLAPLLGAQSCVAPTPRTVNIQSIRASAPFFFLYGGPFFASLTTRVTPSHPMISIALDPRDEREVGSSITLPQVAEMMVRRIQAAQPAGPYRLGGWCVAGLIAYEVASQLVAAGEQVELVAMIGTPNPVYDLSIPSWKVYASKFRHQLKKLGRLRANQALDYAIERIKRLGSTLGEPAPVANSFAEHLEAAALRYVPKPFHARIAVIREADRPEAPDLKIGWEHVLGDRVEVYDVPGDHISIFTEAHAGGLADCVNRCLEREMAPAARPARSAQG